MDELAVASEFKKRYETQKRFDIQQSTFPSCEQLLVLVQTCTFLVFHCKLLVYCHVSIFTLSGLCMYIQSGHCAWVYVCYFVGNVWSTFAVLTCELLYFCLCRFEFRCTFRAPARHAFLCDFQTKVFFL